MATTNIVDKDGNSIDASKATVPSDRHFRNAWSLSGTTITEDMTEANQTKLKDVLVTEEQVYDYLGEDSDGDAVEILANLASGTYTLENLQKDILE